MCIRDSVCPIHSASSAEWVGNDEERQLAQKNHSIVEGVVSGIAGYGNCFGVPNLGGETKFEACYSGNPLVLSLIHICAQWSAGRRYLQS